MLYDRISDFVQMTNKTINNNDRYTASKERKNKTILNTKIFSISSCRLINVQCEYF